MKPLRFILSQKKKKKNQAKVREIEEPRVSMYYHKELWLYNMLLVEAIAAKGDLRRKIFPKCGPLILRLTNLGSI